MSASVSGLHSLWEVLRDRGDELAAAIGNVPCEEEGYQLSAESDREVHEALALIQQAIELLCGVVDRETEPYEIWALSQEDGGPA